MFHVELRQFPHNTHAFNLSERELHGAVLGPWKAGRTFEVAGQRWRPDEAQLTVLEGPRLEAYETSMSRGWSAALKRSRDVTAELLSDPPEAGQAAGPSWLGSAAGFGAAARPAAAPDPEAFAGYKAEILERAAQEPLSPRETWHLAGRWLPTGAVAERLAMAERAVRELLAEELVAIGRGSAANAPAHPVPTADLPMILHAWETWAEDRPGVFLWATAGGAKPVGGSAGR